MEPPKVKRKVVKHYLQGFWTRVLRKVSPRRAVRVRAETIEFVPLEDGAGLIIIGGRASAEERERYSLMSGKLASKKIPLGKKATLSFMEGELAEIVMADIKMELFYGHKWKLLEKLKKTKKPLCISREVIAGEGGLGTKLLALVEGYAMKNGNDFIFAETSNPSAVETYRKRGWILLSRGHCDWRYGLFLNIKK
jgi:hypothetical protein